MDRLPCVRDIMVEAPLSLSPDTAAFQAVDALVAKKVAGVPVINGDGKLVGFLTEKDCLRLMTVSHQYNMTGACVRDIMSEIKAGLHPDMDLWTATMHFLACNFATLPVIEGDKLVGSISRQNMLQAIQRMYYERGLGIRETRETLKIVEGPSSIGQLQILVSKANREQLASVLGRRHAE